MTTTLTFPFTQGLQQSVEDRLLDAGRPRAIENLVIHKRGRLKMRRDYDALAMTMQGGATMTLLDLISFGPRLFGLGEPSTTGTATKATAESFEYVNAAQYAWRMSSDPTASSVRPRLPIAAYPRDIAKVNVGGTGFTSGDKMDVAAGNGLVCMVYETPFSPVRIAVHIVRASNNATVHYEVVNSVQFPRVVCTGTKFFIGCITSGATVPKLFRFDPATDSALVALTDPAGAGAAIVCFDMSLSHERTSFWIAYCRTGPTTRVHGFDVDGTETHDFAGPAVLADFITIFTEAQNAAVQRIHVACVINGTGAVNMSTYLGATSALQTNTPALMTGALCQVGMCMNLASTNAVAVIYQQTTLAKVEDFLNNTHGLIATATYADVTMSSKMLNVRNHQLFAVRLVETTDGFSTNLLMQVCRTVGTHRFSPVAIADRLIAEALSSAELPNLAFDATTGKTYWPRMTTGVLDAKLPVVMELSVAGQERRQAVQLGDCIYIAGGYTTVNDGITLMESGTLDRPRIAITGQSFSGTDHLTVLGTYQFCAVFETFDANGNRIQSHPSDVVEGTLTGINNKFTLSSTIAHTGRDNEFEVPANAPPTYPTTVFYRTQNAANGNLTLYRCTSPSVSEETDAEISENEVLYTQGERESLSGPLPFLAPEGCGVLAASADRVLIGQLPASANIQESRNLIPFEQANWSDSIGFFRATRGRILAVARLDERRIVWTETEIFELDGDGVDDNGNGAIGAPRRLVSECGIYAPPGAPELAWESLVECQLGIMFRGTVDLIYLLPRGSVTPIAIGVDVQDVLSAFPNLTSATYVSQDQTVRFTCNNSGNTDGVIIIYDLEHESWVTEGPFGAPTISSCAYQGRMTTLRGGVVRQQRDSNTPAALIANAWRSGLIHAGGLGAWIRVLNAQFFGEYRGDCALRCIFTFDDLTTETLTTEVNAVSLTAGGEASNAAILGTANYSFAPTLAVGSPYTFKFVPGQFKCESAKVDFEVDVPFPVPINFAAVLNTPTSVSVTLASNRAIGDRVVLVFAFAGDPGTAPASAGWNLRSSSATHAVVERILDGTEVSPVSFTWTNVTVGAATVWTIRNSHPSAALEVSTATLASGNTLSSPELSPSWGTENTLWLAALSLSERPAAASSDANITQVPANFRLGIASGVTSVSALTGCQVSTMVRSLRASSLTPGAWNWVDTSPAVAMTLAIRPNAAIASAGLDYHYWTLDVETAGKSALKSPLQMG